jgi:hypothetical protein
VRRLAADALLEKVIEPPAVALGWNAQGKWHDLARLDGFGQVGRFAGFGQFGGFGRFE